MKTKQNQIIFGLIALVLLLSVIPLAFLGLDNQIDIPDIEDENLVLIGTGDFDGKIISIPYDFSFVGLSTSSDDSNVREMINSINYVDCTKNNENCSVKVGLNPNGDGYSYEIKLRLKNSSDSDYVGFRLSYKLNSILDTSSNSLSKYILVPVSVLLQGTTEIDGTQVVAKNISSIAYVSYSNTANETVDLLCESVTYSKQGILMKAPVCFDNTNYENDFGLDSLTIFENYGLTNKTIELNLDFDKVYFKVIGNFTNSSIEKDLDFATVEFSEDRTFIEISTSNTSKINKIQLALEDYEIIESYKSVFVQLPKLIELEKEYNLIGGFINLNFPITQESGVGNVKLQFTTLFDEIINVIVA